MSQVKVKGFTLDFGVRSISLEPFWPFSLNFTQMFLSVRQCAEFMTLLHRLKVRVTLQGHGIYPSIRVHSISPEPFGHLTSPVSRCAEIIRLRRLKVKVTLQGHVIYPSVSVNSISPEPFERFSLNFTQMLLSVRWCAELITQLRILKVKVTLQGHGINP